MKAKSDFVVPIPPSYDKDENLEIESTASYLKYLQERGANTVMTTAGTSQYNLLSYEEIIQLNRVVCENFEKKKIIGVPSLSKRQCIDFIKSFFLQEDENVFFMFLYPERHYNDDTILNFFKEVKEYTRNPIYIHDMPIRKSTGGMWQYTSQILNRFTNEELAGIKEEHRNLSDSYNFIYNLNDNCDIIVAGGSMRRFEFLKNAGADGFLSGIGNLFPNIEVEYFSGQEQESINKENRLFSIFMKHGWHASLRYALKFLGLTCLNNRQPFVELANPQKKEIEQILKEVNT